MSYTNEGVSQCIDKREREIMLFIGKPMGRSIMISNDKRHNKCHKTKINVVKHFATFECWSSALSTLIIYTKTFQGNLFKSLYLNIIDSVEYHAITTVLLSYGQTRFGHVCYYSYTTCKLCHGFIIRGIVTNVFGSDSVCLTVLTVTLSKKKKHASSGFFVGLSTTNLKMVWKQATNKQM